MNSVTYFTYILFFLTEILLNKLLHSKSTDKQNADKYSISLIWVTIIISIAIAVYIFMSSIFPIFANPLVQYIGVVIIYVGIALRLYAVYSLGKFFTVDVTIRHEHQLKKDGIYKYIRHPSYTASLISFIGMSLTFNNWLSAIVLVVPIIIVYIHRIKIEEEVLMQHFSADYPAYKKSTYALIPFVF